MNDLFVSPLRPKKYVDTSVAVRIKQAVAFATRQQAAVIIRGPAGVGKSSALADVMLHDRNACAFEVPQSGKTERRVLEGVASAFNISHNRAYSADLWNVLLHRLSDEVRAGRYLIVDEVQNASLAGVRTLLTFNEHLGLPLVLSGNPAAIKMTRANAAAFDQIADRVSQWVELASPNDADIHLIAMEHGVEGVEAYRMLVAYGSRGSIRKTVKLLDVARGLAGPEGSIRADHIRVAAEFSHQEDRRLLECFTIKGTA